MTDHEIARLVSDVLDKAGLKEPDIPICCGQPMRAVIWLDSWVTLWQCENAACRKMEAV